MKIKVNDIKKGTTIKCNQLGVPVTGIMLDSLRGNTRLVDVKGSEVGMFDEMGSVYAWNITAAEINGEWVSVELSDSQKTARDRIERDIW